MTIRKAIIEALAKHGQCTYDDIERHTGIARDKARIAISDAISDAKKAGHLTVVKDDFTGQPAYKITVEGRTWLNNYGNIRQAQSKATPPVVAAMRTNDHMLATIDKHYNKADELRKRITQAEADLVKLTNIESELATWKLIASTVGATTPDELKNHLTFQDVELVEAVARANESQQKLADLEIKVDAKIAETKTRLRDMEIATTLKLNPPAGYLIVTPNKPPRKFTKASSADQIAASAARASGMAEVFALYPIKKAVRGIEWKATA